jgi:hypothetical protein
MTIKFQINKTQNSKRFGILDISIGDFFVICFLSFVISIKV